MVIKTIKKILEKIKSIFLFNKVGEKKQRISGSLVIHDVAEENSEEKKPENISNLFGEWEMGEVEKPKKKRPYKKRKKSTDKNKEESTKETKIESTEETKKPKKRYYKKRKPKSDKGE